jgi:triosephosphate isomerase
MLAEIGTQYVIVGHSERRQFFGDTDTIVAKKIQAAYRNNLMPILCVGETAAERKDKKTISKVTRQVASAIAGLTAKQVNELVIAYEPLWAIGSGKTAKVEDALEVAGVIRDKIAKLYDAEVAKRVRILYGGSVNPKNAHDFHKEGIDGVLVGGASLKAKDFVAIVNKF